MKKITVGDKTLTQEEVMNIYISLSLRLGFIETGTHVRAKDLVKVDKDFKPKVLSNEQMRLILDTEDLMSKLL
jgi:hypothetical protein